MTGSGRGARAVFLDRDGTLIRDYHFIGRVEQVEMLPGAAEAVKRLNDGGWLTILVTNQSGIGRGYFTKADYEKVHAHMLQLLAEHGARLDAQYMCPHHPDFTGPCECRKPGTLLYRQAIAAHGIDTTRSWMIGDKLRDVLPAREFSAHGIMVPNEETPPADVELARREFFVARTLGEAVDRVIESAR